ncbi:uncharacterized protein TNCT_62991 [Trichonephila clavata]|uniref:HTH CENPB-type domain-containing protein n=1 Tax=Trichonephila clavata TaxID=2740835 RepID=A0A8X6M502_TRICU|nr:uncharacterized protein TNCT_62991 [Trichonephila clavata]
MENRLSIWIDDEIERNRPFSQSIIMEKTRIIFIYIQVEASDGRETFATNRGWFNGFKHRNSFHNVQVTGEAASGDTKVAAEFPVALKTIIERGNYPPELVFNVAVDETGSFWKRMPKHEVSVEDVEETVGSLSNDELQELADQKAYKNTESSDFEEEQKNFQQRF